MIKKQLNLFPTNIVIYDDFLSSAQTNDIFNYCINDKNMHSEHGSYIGDGVSSFVPYLQKDFLVDVQTKISSCSSIRNDIEKVFNDYCNETNIQNVSLTNSWYNIQQKGSLLFRHDHQMSALSGALYINVDEHSSPLYFENPNPLIFSVLSKSNSCYYNEYYKLTPKKGTLVIFPSWIKHGASKEINQTDHRIVVSINSFYRP